jgi:hypothetical protein
MPVISQPMTIAPGAVAFDMSDGRLNTPRRSRADEQRDQGRKRQLGACRSDRLPFDLGDYGSHQPALVQ